MLYKYIYFLFNYILFISYLDKKSPTRYRQLYNQVQTYLPLFIHVCFGDS